MQKALASTALAVVAVSSATLWFLYGQFGQVVLRGIMGKERVQQPERSFTNTPRPAHSAKMLKDWMETSMIACTLSEATAFTELRKAAESGMGMKMDGAV
eukprot:gnl/TRDRNA2_/TRDRNA2_160400_c0_seq2.p2 gnl/TRDRNA2_/TRDRNA2_160400_c0~~gnl/TRDRNA2_/TRDRNA2_160400_c0_seq2.p2  ORF type:complete len:100 (-),score=14.26 gnl/TRDRNA2_/TRDRNA2_160400_c0_seq2:1141-1440(-)